MTAIADQPRLVPQPRPVRRGGRDRAFTLVEVLATLVLVGIVLPVAMRGVTLSLQTAARSRQTTEAGQLAASKLSELVILQETTGSTGDFPEHPEYRWASTVTERTTGLYEIAVRVAWTAQGLEQWVTLSTLLYAGSTTSTSTRSGVTP